MADGLLAPLLAIGALELLIYRLAAPVMRPGGNQPPGFGHEVLENIGLFGFHLLSLLAPVALVLLAFKPVRRGERSPVAIAILAGSVVLSTFSMGGALTTPLPELGEMLLRYAYAATIVAIVVGAFTRRGDLGVRIGTAVLAIPLLVHVAGPLVLRLKGEEALFTNLPEQLISAGRWALIAAASLTPYCFAPRPFARTIARPAPLVVGGLVGVLATVIVRKHFEVGAVLASRGLGVELGPGMPVSQLALALLALATISWTLVACALADSPARRRVGLGIALVVVAGYGFAWPMQYAMGAVGLMVIANAARRVKHEELSGDPQVFRGPPIQAETWAAYVEALVEALSDDTHALTSFDGARGQKTVLHGEVKGLPLEIEINLDHHAIVSIEILLGETGSDDPAWTLASRAERGLGQHPPPPRCEGAAVLTKTLAFDRRFDLRDTGNYTATLLDDELRKRAIGTIDGWLAYWPGAGLGFAVFPGCGAPLDHPVPITELAFRGTGTPPSVERMMTLIELLAEIASRGERESDADDDDEDESRS